MAATVLNGSGNLPYTNNTGGNVRAIIYYMSSVNNGGTRTISLTSSFGTSTITGNGDFVIGKDIAGGLVTANAVIGIQNVGGSIASGGIPTQIMLAPGQSISATCSGYNVVIIPENG